METEPRRPCPRSSNLPLRSFLLVSSSCGLGGVFRLVRRPWPSGWDRQFGAQSHEENVLRVLNARIDPLHIGGEPQVAADLERVKGLHPLRVVEVDDWREPSAKRRAQ